MIRQLLFYIIILVSFSVSGQNRIFKLVEKTDTLKATEYILKINEKDPNNPDTKLATAYYLQWLHPNDLKLLDSAGSMLSKYLNIASEESKLSESVHPDSLKIRVDSLAFQQLVPPHSQNRFISFITIHNTSEYSSQARVMWEEWAYKTALTTNTEASYNNFKRWFPNSKYNNKIDERLADLEFRQHFTNFTEKEYANFLRKNPSSPYAKEAEAKLAEIVTRSGTKERLSYYATAYPQLKSAQNAQLIVDAHYDSTNEIEALFPFMENSKIGLIDSAGNHIVPAIFDSLEVNDNCEGYLARYIIGYIGKATAVVNRKGNFVFRGPAEKINELSPAFISFVQNGKSGLLLSDGTIILPPIYDEINLPHKNFISAKRDNSIEFRSLLGQMLLSVQDGDLYSENDFIFLETDDQLKVSHASLLSKSKSDQFPWIRNVYDYEVIDNSKIIIENENRWFGVLNNSLQWLRSPSTDKITNSSFGIIISDTSQVRLAYGEVNDLSEPYRRLNSNTKWLLAVNDSSSIVYNKSWSEPLTLDLDTGYILGESFFIGIKNNIPTIYFSDRTDKKFYRTTNFKLVSSSKSGLLQEVIITETGRNHVVFNSKGNQVFEGDGKSYSILSDSLISIMFRSGNYMLKTLSGKTILPGVYDGFAALDSNHLTIVRDGKFGWVNTKTFKTVAPRYSSLPKIDGNKIVTTYGRYQYLLNFDGSTFFRSVADDIKAWNDSSVWIKNNFRWALWDIQKNDSLGIEAKLLETFDINNTERVAVYLTDKGYGAVSSSKGEILAPEYTSIEFRGNSKNSVLFAFKDFEEAGYRTIVYMSPKGIQLIEESEKITTSDKILCD
ncbi:WG repeat-containing protein [Marinigracilibium pacificum]|uniref:WG repeat protein n=1 Tax=Marinigracilibium pacificum TaxID=2729599 RepID=A0A848J527_9BACT|nr:WG repeat-containing protein [Marinigracilibium pacificum]NMM50368.1 hypothetical protein [Marinigracilibium pacificum]